MKLNIADSRARLIHVNETLNRSRICVPICDKSNMRTILKPVVSACARRPRVQINTPNRIRPGVERHMNVSQVWDTDGEETPANASTVHTETQPHFNDCLDCTRFYCRDYTILGD